MHFFSIEFIELQWVKEKQTIVRSILSYKQNYN